MNTILLFILSLFIGIASIFVTNLFRVKTTELKITHKVQQEQQFLTDQAPSNSLKGMIDYLSGVVKWESRVATQAAVIVEPRAIRQGEMLETEEGKISVTFADTGTFSIFSKSQLSFIQTLPTNIVLSQTKGTGDYIKSGNVPISIRSLHLLTLITSGEVNITVDDNSPNIHVVVKKGEATIAFNDKQNLSNVVKLSEGQEYLFNNETWRGYIQ